MNEDVTLEAIGSATRSRETATHRQRMQQHHPTRQPASLPACRHASHPPLSFASLCDRMRMVLSSFCSVLAPPPLAPSLARMPLTLHQGSQEEAPGG